MGENKLKELDLLLYKKFGIKIENDQNLGITFRQMGIDSLQIVALVSEIEEMYNIRFSIDDLDQIDNLKNLYECLHIKLM